MKVLVACECSGVVREAFKAKGHDAWSCDILPTEIAGQHHQGDVLDILNDGWDLIIAHPPCTYLCNSGVCHLGTQPGRYKKMEDAALFFKKFLEVDCDKVAIENPIMHGYAKNIIEANQTQVIQPWMFGHTEKKATCLWLKGLPKLEPTNNVYDEMIKLPKNKQQRLHYLPPGVNRAKERSRTYQGIANAMAEQWGNL